MLWAYVFMSARLIEKHVASADLSHSHTPKTPWLRQTSATRHTPDGVGLMSNVPISGDERVSRGGR